MKPETLDELSLAVLQILYSDDPRITSFDEMWELAQATMRYQVLEPNFGGCLGTLLNTQAIQRHSKNYYSITSLGIAQVTEAYYATQIRMYGQIKHDI